MAGLGDTALHLHWSQPQPQPQQTQTSFDVRLHGEILSAKPMDSLIHLHDSSGFGV